MDIPVDPRNICEVLQQQAYLLFYTRISAGQEVRLEGCDCFSPPWVQINSWNLKSTWFFQRTINFQTFWVQNLNPNLPKSSKYLLRRCLDPLKAFSGGIWKTRVIFRGLFLNKKDATKWRLIWMLNGWIRSLEV